MNFEKLKNCQQCWYKPIKKKLSERSGKLIHLNYVNASYHVMRETTYPANDNRTQEFCWAKTK